MPDPEPNISSQPDILGVPWTDWGEPAGLQRRGPRAIELSTSDPEVRDNRRVLKQDARLDRVNQIQDRLLAQEEQTLRSIQQLLDELRGFTGSSEQNAALADQINALAARFGFATSMGLPDGRQLVTLSGKASGFAAYSPAGEVVWSSSEFPQLTVQPRATISSAGWESLTGPAVKRPLPADPLEQIRALEALAVRGERPTLKVLSRAVSKLAGTRTDDPESKRVLVRHLKNLLDVCNAELLFEGDPVSSLGTSMTARSHGRFVVFTGTDDDRRKRYGSVKFPRLGVRAKST